MANSIPGYKCFPLLVVNIVTEVMIFAPEADEDYASREVLWACERASKLAYGDEKKIFTLSTHDPLIKGFRKDLVTNMLERMVGFSDMNDALRTTSYIPMHWLQNACELRAI